MVKSLALENKENEELEKNKKCSGNQLIWTAIVFTVAAAAFFFQQDEISTDMAIESNESDQMQKDFLAGRRKVNRFMEFEDIFDTSMEVSAWDVHRPLKIEESLQTAFRLYEKGKFEAAKRKFLANRGFWWLYGAAISIDKLIQPENGGKMSNEDMKLYDELCSLRTNAEEAKTAHIAICRRFVQILRQNRQLKESLKVLSNLRNRFPSEKAILYDIGDFFLFAYQFSKAKLIFESLVKSNSSDGYAMMQLGLILKGQGDLQNAVRYLRRAVKSGHPGVNDVRTYCQLGEALSLRNQHEEALQIYEKGVVKGLFRSTICRPVFHVANLTAKPVWKISETGHEAELKMLQDNWKDIRQEALDLNKKGLFRLSVTDRFTEQGELKFLMLYSLGKKIEESCKYAPITCGLIGKFPDASNCRHGQIKFAIMKPGTHVKPHTSPTNARLRAHLGLKVPSAAALTVDNNKILKWTEGEFFIFDDHFEHFVWHNGTDDRLILLVDFWHPDMSEKQKSGIRPLENYFTRLYQWNATILTKA